MIDATSRSRQRLPAASPFEVAAEPAPFPVTTDALPVESFFPDWRRRLVRNLARRSDGRWDPLTRVWAGLNPAAPTTTDATSASPSPFAEHRGTQLWDAVEDSINELVTTREVSVHTARDYVVGYLCRELVAKRLILSTSPEP